MRKLAKASEHTVVAPNNDTLYSMAWLNLSKEPQVLHAPAIHNRFWEFELVDPWTNNFYNVTSAHRPLGRGDFRVTGGGDWAIVGPDFHGKLPAGVTKVRSPYDRVWVIGRTYIRGKSDLRRFTRSRTATRSCRWRSSGPAGSAGRPGTSTASQPRRPSRGRSRATTRSTSTARSATRCRSSRPRWPTTQWSDSSPRWASALGWIRPPPASARTPSTACARRWARAPPRSRTICAPSTSAGSADHNGYLIGDLGDWGTDYQLRAIGDRVGVGGQRANIAVYPFALTDNALASLSGSKRYVLHIPAEDLPIPARAFWSLTLYNGHTFFVHNPLHRYVLNDRSNLQSNPNGSIDLYIQHDEPSSKADRRNWLPAPPPSGSFRLIWRLYDLGGAMDGVLDGTGWQPPPIQPCDGTNHAADGTACAS